MERVESWEEEGKTHKKKSGADAGLVLLMNINQKRISSSEENTRTPSFRELTLLNTLLNLSFSGLRPFDFAFHIYIHRRPGRLGPHFCTYVSRRFFTRPSRARRRARRAKRAMMRLLRLVHDEGGHLHLLLGVEADHPDVVVWRE